MRRILFGSFLVLALAGTVLAQRPVDSSIPASGPPAAMPAANGAGDPSGCAPSCGVCLKTICVPENTTKVTVKPLYSKVCEPLCFPKWSLRLGFHHCEEACATCEHPRTKYYLVVRPCKEERPAVVCKPVLVEACAPSCGGGPAACSAAVRGTEVVSPVPAYVPLASEPIPASMQLRR
jgi:hypothetical protein